MQMVNINRYIKYVIALFLGLVLMQSCEHDPIIIEMEPEEMDTMEVEQDTLITEMDTTMVEPMPCSPDTVYFNQQLLPIFISNCAISGCHDAASAADDVILDSYENIVSTTEVKPFDLSEGDLYEVITEDNPQSLMPPPPANPLSNDQINMIAQWILHGAQNLECEEDDGCDTNDVSFSDFVSPTIANFCGGCHSAAIPSGGIILDNYDNIKVHADNGKLYGTISWSPGFIAMPLGEDQMDECTIDKIKSWIDDGAQDN